MADEMTFCELLSDLADECCQTDRSMILSFVSVVLGEDEDFMLIPIVRTLFLNWLFSDIGISHLVKRIKSLPEDRRAKLLEELNK